MQSPEIQAWAAGFPVSLLHGAAMLLILFAAAGLYVLIAPRADIQRLRDRNLAAVISLAGILVGLAAPLAVCLQRATSLGDVFLWGVTTTLVQLAVFRLIDLIPRVLLRGSVEDDMPMALLLTGAKLAAAMILAAAVAA